MNAVIQSGDCKRSIFALPYLPAQTFKGRSAVARSTSLDTFARLALPIAATPQRRNRLVPDANYPVGVTLKRHGREYGYYVCSARWKRPLRGERCQSRSLGVDILQGAVFDIVVGFLNGPDGFGNELQRRQGLSVESEASLIRELESLKRQHREEQDVEARAFRLASRGNPWIERVVPFGRRLFP